MLNYINQALLHSQEQHSTPSNYSEFFVRLYAEMNDSN
jgi:hypothetical protein